MSTVRSGATSGSWAASVGCVAPGRPGRRRRHRRRHPRERSLRSEARLSWPPKPCVVQGIDARCGTFVVPENRAKPDGRTIGLHVVVLPAFSKPARKEAVTYLAGGPGDAATEQALSQGWQSSALRTYRDILLVDQRGTGRIEATRRRCDPVRDTNGDGRPRRGAGGARLPAARRDRQLLRRHRGAGLPEPPSLLGAHAHPHGRNRDRRPLLRPLRRQRPTCPRPTRAALRLRPRLPESVPRLGAPVPRAREGLERPPRERHDRATSSPRSSTRCCSTWTKAVSIPLVVSSAAKGDYAPLEAAGLGGSRRQPGADGLVDLVQRALDRARCEGAVGHRLRQLRRPLISRSSGRTARSVPKRAEPRSLWTLPTSSPVPVLALVGGADPQDPVTNLADLKRHFPDSRTLIFPHTGHQFRIGGCIDPILTDFVERGTTKGLDTTGCDGAVVVPPFDLPD